MNQAEIILEIMGKHFPQAVESATRITMIGGELTLMVAVGDEFYQVPMEEIATQGCGDEDAKRFSEYWAAAIKRNISDVSSNQEVMK